jgi:hypothetical protein
MHALSSIERIENNCLVKFSLYVVEFKRHVKEAGIEWKFYKNAECTI